MRSTRNNAGPEAHNEENGRRQGVIPEMIRQRRLTIFLAAALLIILIGSLSLSPPLASLLTFRKVDDYPLYTMQYHGDYHFLQTRELETTSSINSYLGQQNQQPACTVFYGRTGQGEALLGRNFDWKHRSTLLLYTDPPDGYASVSMVDLGYFGFDEGVSWQAINDLKQAPFWPFDGMNERGVGIGIMAVPAAPGLFDPNKPTLDSLEVVRLILDYAGNLDEALELIQNVNIDFSGGPWLHYLISDRQSSAVVEIHSDRIEILRSQQPWQAATNFILAGLSEEEADRSCRRYKKASNTLEAAQGVLEPLAAMQLLKDTSQENTVWSVLYNLRSGEIQIALGRDYADVHLFDLGNPLEEIK